MTLLKYVNALCVAVLGHQYFLTAMYCTFLGKPCFFQASSSDTSVATSVHTKLPWCYFLWQARCPIYILEWTNKKAFLGIGVLRRNLPSVWGGRIGWDISGPAVPAQGASNGSWQWHCTEQKHRLWWMRLQAAEGTKLGAKPRHCTVPKRQLSKVHQSDSPLLMENRACP